MGVAQNRLSDTAYLEGLLVSSIDPRLEEAAADLLNFRNESFEGVHSGICWGGENNIISVRWTPQKSRDRQPKIWVFVERPEGGYFQELEGASVRVYDEAPVTSDSRGRNHKVYLKRPVAVGTLDRGRADIGLPCVGVFFVEIVRQMIPSTEKSPSQMAMTIS